MRHRPSPSEILAWTLVGGTLGFLAGFALGEWLGPMTTARVGRTLTGGGGQTGPRLKAAETARVARLALEQDQQLRDFELQPIAVGPGVVELHGWVPDRRLRARAARTVAAAEGIDSLINCLLVRGEDDETRPFGDATDQPA
jgi:hypothetical protein